MNNKKLVFFLMLVGLIVLPTGREMSAALDADMVIFNGKILTADSPEPNHFSVAQAVAIYDGKIIAVGTNEEALKYAGASTQKVDLGGRTVIPGLVETHHHTMSYASHFFPAEKPRPGRTDPPIRWTNKDQFLVQLRTLAVDKKPGEWIVTSPIGGQMNVVVELHRGDVTRFDLDKVAPNNPVHIHWLVSDEGLVNTKALDLLLGRWPDIRGVLRDASGVPTGRLTGAANMVMQYEFRPQIPAAEMAPYYLMELDETTAQGITTLSTRLAPDELRAYALLHARGELQMRVGYSMDGVVNFPKPEALYSRLVGMQGATGEHIWGLGDNMLWLIGFSPTFNIDHTPGTAGSCIEKTYPRENPNYPLWRDQIHGPHGLCRLEDPNYFDVEGLRAAAKYGVRHSAMHSGGDRGINQYLDLVEELAKEYPHITELRWGIDHCRFLTDEHARRAKKLNLIFSCGPKYVYAGSKGDIGAFGAIYGTQVASDVVVPLRRLIDHGLRTTMQLDEHGFHPFLALQTAVTRMDVDGKMWGPQQRISRQEALYMFTRWSAEYLLKEKLIGSIEPKKLADFVVLDRDYLTVPETEIGRIDPLLTVVGGKIVYSAPQFATSLGLPQAGYRGSRDGWKRQ